MTTEWELGAAWIDLVFRSGAILCLVMGGVGVLLTLLGNRAVRQVLEQAATAAPAGHCPPISVLRPVKGLDVGLEENIASLARQQYPAFEILIGAADPDDPALEVARKVAGDFPEVPIRVCVCREATGFNPKVSILEVLSGRAAFDAILISDSNVRVQPDYLQQLAAQAARPGVGLVTNLILGSGADSLGSKLETLILATFVGRATSFAQRYLDRACVVGKSMFFRRSDLARLGGWPSVRNVLAEDYVLGRAFRAAGYLVAVAPSAVQCYVPGWTLRRFWARHSRWAQMRRRISLAGYLLEPLLYPAPSLLLATALACVVGADELAWAALVVLLVRLGLDGLLLTRLHGARPDWTLLLLGIVKDCVAFAVWGLAWFRHTTTWRGNRLRIGRDSVLSPVGPSEPRFGAADAATASPLR